MTEAEWLACNDAIEKLIFIKQHRGIRRQKKQRKQRLFSAACCRRILPLIGNNRCQYCVEVTERFADDQATSEELQAAEAEANAVWLTDAANSALLACLQACYKSNDGMHVSTTTIEAVFEQQQKAVKKSVDPLAGRRRGACLSEEREQCGILRCIFGNPFRPIALDFACRTSTVVSVARAAYDERHLPSGELDLHRLAVLADAVEEAGASDELVAHLRRLGPHVRGCFAVDLCLGLN
jgi:hypothetical protein